MSFVKYRLKEVAADFGVTPKDIAEIISKYYDRPKSNTQVLNDNELNAVFDHITRNNQIKSLEQVFAVQPKKQPEPAKEAPKAAAPQQSRGQQQGNRSATQNQQGRPQNAAPQQ